MATIYQKKSTSRWYARIKDADGRWRDVSLESRHSGPMKVTWQKAMQEAQEREEMVQAAVRGELTFQAIVEAGRRTMERNHGGVAKSVTIREYLQGWLKNRTLRISAATVESYTTQIERFLEVIGTRADRSLLSLKVELLEEHRDELLKSLSSATVILHCKTIGSALGEAHAKGKLPNNPFDALDLPVKESAEKKPFTEDEVRRILDAAEGEWKTVCLFGAYTGARQGDCTSMKWEYVNFEDNSITYTPDKQKRGTEKPLTAALHPVLTAHLRKLASAYAELPKGYITPRLQKLGPGGRTGLSGEFAAIMKKAGVDQLKSSRGSGRSFSAKSFHSFRHTITTLMAKGGASEEVRRKITGHKSKEVHQIYTHHDLEDQQKALSGLGDFTSGSTEPSTPTVSEGDAVMAKLIAGRRAAKK